MGSQRRSRAASSSRPTSWAPVYGTRRVASSVRAEIIALVYFGYRLWNARNLHHVGSRGWGRNDMRFRWQARHFDVSSPPLSLLANAVDMR